jgi:2-iminoacetate synthase
MELSQGAIDFIDDAYLTQLLGGPPPERKHVQDIIAKSLAKQPLTVEETAVLLRTDDVSLLDEVFQTAQTL